MSNMKQSAYPGVKKVLLVTDAGLLESGAADDVAEVIREKGFKVALFPIAEQNPTNKNVEEGLKVFLDEQCDSIITFGGVSSHDAGKKIGLAAANSGRIHDYEGGNRPKNPKLKLVVNNGR